MPTLVTMLRAMVAILTETIAGSTVETASSVRDHTHGNDVHLWNSMVMHEDMYILWQYKGNI